MKNDIWEDPMVKEVLKERASSDIAVLHCPQCSRLGYYNEGSHFTCRHCDKTFYCVSEDETPPEDRPWMWLDGVLALSDIGNGDFI